MTRLRALLTALLLLSLAPAALGGHVQVDVNPCAGADALAPLPGCRGDEPIPECWRRDGREGFPVYDPLLCPGSAGDGSCIALGVHAQAPLGLVTQMSRSETDATWGARSGAAAAQQSLAMLVGSEGTLITSCEVDLTGPKCQVVSDARAADVSLLGGRIEAAALDAHVALCADGWAQETRVSSLVIDGVEYGDLVHPSRIVIPGVAIVTIGATDTFPTINGGWGMSATALRVDLLDPMGNPIGLVLVSHASGALRM